MKIQFSRENTQETNEVYQKLLDASEAVFINEEPSSLSKDQQKLIFDILKEIDLSTAELRKNLVQRIEADPKITRVVHLAIALGDKTQDDSLAFDQELIRSCLDSLEYIDIVIPPSDQDQLIRDFWTKYSALFDKQTLESVGTDDLYQLTYLIYMTAGLNLPQHQTVVEALPEQGKKYYQVLQLDPSDFWEEICKIHPNASEDRFIALSHYISSNKLPLSDVQSILSSSDDLSKLLPYLRFGDFRDVSDEIVTNTLQKATKLQYVKISSPSITTLPGLSSCKVLYCSDCPSLEELPELLVCEKLVCVNCISLQKLPELPLCRELYCSNCSSLEKLPKLPVCKRLECCDCTSLKKLPKLPACKKLYCSNCSFLNKLPKLPVCKKLDCCGCSSLKKLPKLPACQKLYCARCPSLKKLPELPLCKQLHCSDCPSLKKLPELPLCKRLYCFRSPSLVTLPELPLCRDLECYDCASLIRLPELPLCKRISCFGCSSLQELPQVLPACAQLKCEECPSLRDSLPELPSHAQVYRRTSTQVHEKLLDVTATVYTNQGNEDLSSLSKDQQKLVFDVLKETDLSTAELRKNLVQRIEADPKITRVVHLAITLEDKTQDDYLTLDQQLIQSSIDALEYIDLGEENHLIRDRWAKYSILFDKQTLESVGTDDLYHLTSLIYKTASLNLPKHQTVVKALPEQGKKYYDALQLGLSDFWKEICKINPNSTEEHFIGLAHYISAKRLPFLDVQSLLSSNDDLSKLLPYLRFGDFRSVNDEITINTLQKATKLQYVTISSSSITTIPKLPACKLLICHICVSLKEILALPLCQTLYCHNCSSLKELPELPLCEKVYCYNCSSLQELPKALPACVHLECEECPSLSNRMPELPSHAKVNIARTSTQVYEKLLDVTATVYTNQGNEDLSSLSKDQQKLIFDILKEINLSKAQIRKNLVQKIEADPKITRVVHLAITLRDKIEDAYLALHQELMRSFVDSLQYIAIAEDPLDKDQLIRNWWTKYGALFDKQTLELLSRDDLYPLTSLLYQIASLNLPRHQTIIEALPEQGKRYYKALQLGLLDFWKEICTTHPNPSEDRFIALAHYISAKQLPFLDVQTLLSSNDDLSKLLPYLRFGDFKNVNDQIIITALKAATKLQYITISSSSITKLPELPACKELNCSYCFSLNKLPELPLCKKLHCYSCSSLENLPKLPLCEFINCWGCSSLRTLPELPLCKSLNCWGCPSLRILPELPLCTHLDCSDCSSLQALPQALPVCEELSCEDCPLLGDRMPELPWNALVYSNLQFTKLEIDLDELSLNPRKLLLELGSHLLQNKPFPNIYYQLQGKLSAAIDIGGVRRDFISRLMESLFAESPMSGKLVINHQKLPQLNDKEDIDCYRTIGRIFALCYPENSYFKTGTLFSTDLYQKIIFLAHPSLAALDITYDDNIFSTYLHYRNFSGFLQLIDRTDHNMEEIEDQTLVDAYDFLDIEREPDRDIRIEKARICFKNQKNREFLKKEVVEAAQLDTQFHAIRIIAQEARNKIDASRWSNLYQETSGNIQKRIEGELSKEALLNKVHWEETPSSFHLNLQLKEKTKGYLKSWIGRASIEDLKKFVRAVTSNNTLGPNQLKIQLFSRGTEFVPVTHTCFFTLELSAEYLDQETFDKKINLLLTEGIAGSGFQVA